MELRSLGSLEPLSTKSRKFCEKVVSRIKAAGEKREYHLKDFVDTGNQNAVHSSVKIIGELELKSYIVYDVNSGTFTITQLFKERFLKQQIIVK